jgi:two-component system, OmpR family, KDP operon response regulator KdpE
MHWFKYYHLTKRSQEKEHIYAYKKLLYDIDRHEFIVEEKTIPLTKKSKYVLSIFFTHAEKLLSESFLIGKVWGDTCIEVRRNIRINISRLRQALEPFSIHTWIQNIHGEGYIFSENE